MDASEHDGLASMPFPRQHRTKLHSTNPIARLNREAKRRADVVGTFPNEASSKRLIGAVLVERNDARQSSSRSMLLAPFARIDTEAIDPILGITATAARSGRQTVREVTPASRTRPPAAWGGAGRRRGDIAGGPLRRRFG